MIGAIAEAYYGPLDPDLLYKVKRLLPDDLGRIVDQFRRRHVSHAFSIV